jgi:hypothetical protein
MDLLDQQPIAIQCTRDGPQPPRLISTVVVRAPRKLHRGDVIASSIESGIGFIPREREQYVALHCLHLQTLTEFSALLDITGVYCAMRTYSGLASAKSMGEFMFTRSLVAELGEIVLPATASLRTFLGKGWFSPTSSDGSQDFALPLYCGTRNR